MTKTEKYIKQAVEEAKHKLGGHSFNNVHVTMDMTADGATQTLAQALLAQAEANEANSRAMMKLAESLKPVDVCAFKITNESVKGPQ